MFCVWATQQNHIYSNGRGTTPEDYFRSQVSLLGTLALEISQVSTLCVISEDSGLRSCSMRKAVLLEYALDEPADVKNPSQALALARTINILETSKKFGEAPGKCRGLLHFDDCWWYMKILSSS